MELKYVCILLVAVSSSVLGQLPAIVKNINEEVKTVGQTVHLNCTVAFQGRNYVQWEKLPEEAGGLPTLISRNTEIIAKNNISVFTGLEKYDIFKRLTYNDRYVYTLVVRELETRDSGDYRCFIKVIGQQWPTYPWKIGRLTVSACPLHLFGQNCSKSCNCKSLSECAKPNFTCSSGCQDGFMGDTCQTECPDYSFGQSCAKKCRCRNVTEVCRKPDGYCPSGCRDGYHGPGCQTGCRHRLFGMHCATRCNCRDVRERCQITNGSCTSGCADGYHGSNCSIACSNGYYGMECAIPCDTCASRQEGEEKCHHVTGQCYFGCTPGYTESLCHRVCDMGQYGLNCINNCNENCIAKVNGSSPCSHVSGRCRYGCQDGYINDSLCQPEPFVTAGNPTSFNSWEIAGIIIGCLQGLALRAALFVI